MDFIKNFRKRLAKEDIIWILRVWCWITLSLPICFTVSPWMILPLVGLITFEVFARRRRKKEYKLRLISALSVMDDQEALRLLSEVIENVKKTTEAHKPRFYNIYELTMASVGRISSHAKNENLRARFFYFQMLDAILEVRYNYVLQTRIKAA
jgi:hypothetical protein